MRYFKKFVFVFEKRDLLARRLLLARFTCSPYNRLKNLFAGVNATRSTTRILLREMRLQPKVFFAQKLSNLGPRAEQIDATHAYHRGGRGRWGLVG